VTVNIGTLTAQEHGRIIIIRDCPEFKWSLPDVYIINAKDHNEVSKFFENDNAQNSIIAVTEAERLTNKEDMVVGVLYQYTDDEKPWTGLGLYYVILRDSDAWYISKTKINLGNEVILLGFSSFVRLRI
jgi:hypothetical protein